MEQVARGRTDPQMPRHHQGETKVEPSSCELGQSGQEPGLAWPRGEPGGSSESLDHPGHFGSFGSNK